MGSKTVLPPRPMHSEGGRKKAERVIWSPLVSPREEPQPTALNHLQACYRGNQSEALIRPSSHRPALSGAGESFDFFSPSTYININASQRGAWATRIIIFNRGLNIVTCSVLTEPDGTSATPQRDPHTSRSSVSCLLRQAQA